MILPKLYQPQKSQPKLYRRLFSFSRPRPWAYFFNGPNAAASIAPTLIRHWRAFARRAAVHCAAAIDRYLPLAGPTAANLQQRICYCVPTPGRTDRRTDAICIDPAWHSMRAVPIIEWYRSVLPSSFYMAFP